MTEPAHLATVTRLAPSPAQLPLPVPIGSVQGALALDLGTTLLPVEQARSATPPTEPEVRRWVAGFARAVMESTCGDRPLPQLLRLTTPPVYRGLENRIARLGPPPAGPGRRASTPQVRSVHVFEVRPGCFEVSVHLRHGERSRALAARVEHLGGRFQCSALHIG